MTKCAACGRFVAASDGVRCTKCNGFFEKACVKLAKSSKALLDWTCPGCASKTPRKYSSDSSSTENKTSTQPSGAESSKTSNDEVAAATADASPTVYSAAASDPGLAREIGLFRQEMVSLRQKMTQFAQKMEAMIALMNGVNDRLTQVESRVSAIEEDNNNRLDLLESRVLTLEERDGCGTSGPSDISELVHTVDLLKQELNDRDQELLSTDVEITGLPEAKNENPVHLVQLAVGKLGVQLEARDVVSVERVGALRRSGEDGDKGAPRPLAVRLARRDVRDQLLKEARVRRTTDTSGLELPGPARRFYINERLTRTNRQLFGKVRQEAKSRNWKFVWTRGGRIYARRLNDSEACRIRTERDIAKVFGSG